MTTPVETPREQSWREIRQSVAPAAMTTHGRRRLGLNLLRGTCTVLVLAGIAAIGILLGRGTDQPGGKLAPVTNADPLREVVVLTDGVLTKEWVLQRLELPESIALIAIDLHLMKARLESEGQVRSIVVARNFPDTLVVTIEERVPVARAMAPLDPGRPEQLFAARDGIIYRGYNYDPSMVARLPWLDGLKLVRSGAGFEAVDGLDRVSELLLAAEHDAPHLVRDWRIVSLADLPRLIVRTNAVREIVFETGNYRRQFARLDYILDFYRHQTGTPAIKRIDLSIAAQVAIEFVKPLPTRPATGAAGTTSVSYNTRNTSTPRINRGL